MMVVLLTAVLLVVVAFALTAPLKLEWRRLRGQSSRWSARWLFVRLEPRKKPPDRAERPKATAPRREKPPRRGRAKTRIPLKTLWREKELFAEVLRCLVRFVFDLLGSLRSDVAELWLRISSSDPFALGTLSATAYTAAQALRNRAQINVIPDFEAFEDSAEVWGRVRISVRPYRLLWALLRLAVHLPKRRLWKFIKRLRAQSKEVSDAVGVVHI